ncbi:MAG: hypothetical protein ACE5IK_09565 [Acidobacteriota bacterium]
MKRLLAALVVVAVVAFSGSYIVASTVLTPMVCSPASCCGHCVK